MKMTKLALLITTLLSAPSAFAQNSPMPKPFLSPLASLQKGDAHFICREPGMINGLGGGAARFTLKLKASSPRPELEVVDAQLGNVDREGKVSNWKAPNLDFTKGEGTVYFADHPDFESLEYTATYFGVPRANETGAGREVSFTVSQDVWNKIVFVRAKDVAVLERAAAGCGQTPPGCRDKTATILDSVYMCDYLTK
jgi:hypothetical protein